MKRLPFLDWMRGLAVVVMIQCHVFNAFLRPDLQGRGAYILSQFIGGMAAPLFLFMAGMTLGFQMDSLERREVGRRSRWLVSLKRAGYIWLIAYAFRFTNYVGCLPSADWREFVKVDILNCMGLAMTAFAALAAVDGKARARWAVVGGLAVAAAAPLVAHVTWGAIPALVQDYLAPGRGRGHFGFFPNAAYIGFGLAAGTVVKRTSAERLEALMQWAVLIGIALVLAAQYASNLPYSIYPQSNFWTDSPALILIRFGITLSLLAGSYVWTAYAAGTGWSWMQVLGKNSLLVYWVHVMLVYGKPMQPFKHVLGLGPTVVAVVGVTGLMVALAWWWMGWKARRAERVRAVPAAAAEPELQAVEAG